MEAETNVKVLYNFISVIKDTPNMPFSYLSINDQLYPCSKSVNVMIRIEKTLKFETNIKRSYSSKEIFLINQVASHEAMIYGPLIATSSSNFLLFPMTWNLIMARPFKHP